MEIRDKQTLRRRLRSLLSEGCGEKEDALICAAIMELPCWQQAESVFCYMPCKGEIDVLPLLLNCLEQGRQLYLPRIEAKGKMSAARLYSMEELVSGAFDIPAPPDVAPVCDDPRLVIVPGLAFDPKNLMRLGRGGGYYDRWLAGKTGKLIAPCRSIQLVEDIPHGRYDIPMHMLVTAEKIYEK